MNSHVFKLSQRSKLMTACHRCPNIRRRMRSLRCNKMKRTGDRLAYTHTYTNWKTTWCILIHSHNYTNRVEKYKFKADESQITKKVHAKSYCISKSQAHTHSKHTHSPSTHTLQLTSQISPLFNAPDAHLQPHLALVHVCQWRRISRASRTHGNLQEICTIQPSSGEHWYTDTLISETPLCFSGRALFPLLRLFTSDFQSERARLPL